MCTVTYVPLRGQQLITHSRDEKRRRLQALPPDLCRIGNQQLLFPRDGQAGGSWVALNEQGHALVLLNGGLVKHMPSPPYRMSRGLVFLEIAASTDLLYAWQQIDLTNIEPFTLLVFNNKELWEYRWSGQKKSAVPQDPTRPHIWSSVTLYEPAVMTRRQHWFKQWLLLNEDPGQESVIDFHLSAGEGDQYNDIRMNRNEEMLTVSISGIRLMPDKGSLRYIDLLAGKEFSRDIGFITRSTGEGIHDRSPVFRRNTYEP